MKSIYLLIPVLILSLAGCKNSEPTSSAVISSEINPPIRTSFKIAVSAMDPQPIIPGLQAGVRGYSDSKLLFLAGRTTGFHGLIATDTTFSTRGANTNIYVVDINTWKSVSVPLPTDPELIPLTGTNLQYYQDGDTLYLMGGYCRRQMNDIQNNFTSDQCIAIHVPSMIQAVMNKTDIRKAILYRLRSPFFKVTGGELQKYKGWYYLMYGQVYDQPYSVSVSGKYTESVRIFRIINGRLTDTSSVRDTLFHRRDLNVVRVKQNNGDFFAAYGGVFNRNNKGFLHPVYIYPNNGKITYKVDTLTQITNQYDCAKMTVFDTNSNTHVTVLLGGIGESFFDKKKGIWDPNGDDGNPLPFVKAITQMRCVNGKVSQYVQNPLTDPEMPDFIGADAFFIPIYAIRFDDLTIDASKIPRDSSTVGYLYGGIRSSRPTSSDIYPTSVNKTLYRVMMIKR